MKSTNATSPSPGRYVRRWALPPWQSKACAWKSRQWPPKAEVMPGRHFAATMPASVTSLTKKTMSLPKHHLELLSPARDVAIAREAILHGADAVYIGGPSFGARHNACNEVSEIADLVEFARRYHARVFTTINTILHDDELEPARKLIHQLYDAGVDALIVLDLGVMEQIGRAHV